VTTENGIKVILTLEEVSLSIATPDEGSVNVIRNACKTNRDLLWVTRTHFFVTESPVLASLLILSKFYVKQTNHQLHRFNSGKYTRIRKEMEKEGLMSHHDFNKCITFIFFVCDIRDREGH
jgi:phage host-nuclease inhibitor protein Gam